MAHCLSPLFPHIREPGVRVRLGEAARVHLVDAPGRGQVDDVLLAHDERTVLVATFQEALHPSLRRSRKASSAL